MRSAFTATWRCGLRLRRISTTTTTTTITTATITPAATSTGTSGGPSALFLATAARDAKMQDGVRAGQAGLSSSRTRCIKERRCIQSRPESLMSREGGPVQASNQVKIYTRETRCRTTRGTSGSSIRRGRGRRPRIARSRSRRNGRGDDGKCDIYVYEREFTVRDDEGSRG